MFFFCLFLQIREAANETNSKFDDPTNESVNFIENSETDSQTLPSAQTTGKFCKKNRGIVTIIFTKMFCYFIGNNGERMDYFSLAANPVDDLGGQPVTLPKDFVEQLQKSLSASADNSSKDWSGQIYSDYQTNVVSSFRHL